MAYVLTVQLSKPEVLEADKPTQYVTDFLGPESEVRGTAGMYNNPEWLDRAMSLNYEKGELVEYKGELWTLDGWTVHPPRKAPKSEVTHG